MSMLALHPNHRNIATDLSSVYNAGYTPSNAFATTRNYDNSSVYGVRQSTVAAQLPSQPSAYVSSSGGSNIFRSSGKSHITPTHTGSSAMSRTATLVDNTLSMSVDPQAAYASNYRYGSVPDPAVAQIASTSAAESLASIYGTFATATTPQHNRTPVMTTTVTTSTSQPSLPPLSEVFPSQAQTTTQQFAMQPQAQTEVVSMAMQPQTTSYAQSIAGGYYPGNLQYPDMNAQYVQQADGTYTAASSPRMAVHPIHQSTQTFPGVDIRTLPPITEAQAASAAIQMAAAVSPSMMATSALARRRGILSISTTGLNIPGVDSPPLSSTSSVYSAHPQQTSFTNGTQHAVDSRSTASSRRNTILSDDGSDCSSLSPTTGAPPTASADRPPQKVYSFIALPGINTAKRPRRKFEEIERNYACNYQGCDKSYGTLNHLNAHVSMQRHGVKRRPSEFKELRKQWRRQKREDEERRAVAEAMAMNLPSAS